MKSIVIAITLLIATNAFAYRYDSDELVYAADMQRQTRAMEDMANRPSSNAARVDILDY